MMMRYDVDVGFANEDVDHVHKSQLPEHDHEASDCPRRCGRESLKCLSSCCCRVYYSPGLLIYGELDGKLAVLPCLLIICIPRTQMTLVLIGKGLVLGG